MRLGADFYSQDALSVAEKLLGKVIVRNIDGIIIKARITETEAYRGEEDSACHARFGRTQRNFVLYEQAGLTYVYLCYGIHFLFNVVTGQKGEPQAVLIRGVEGFNGPGKLTKYMHIDKSLNCEDLSVSNEIWIEDNGFKCNFITTPRIGIDYANEPYKSIEWRFLAK